MRIDLRLLLMLNDTAEILPRLPIKFRDGHILLRDQSKANAYRLAAEDNSWLVVCGWLIIGACIFTKHSVVADRTGRFYEITPHADPLPFAKHQESIGNYEALAGEIFLLHGED